MSFAAPARAFEVIYHEQITKLALSGIRVTISGHEYGFTEKAVLEICEYNVATDNLFLLPNAALFHPEWHFTNEEFKASSTWLIEAKDQALDALQSSPAPLGSLARQKIGRALHTVQDFYSHSNWGTVGGTGFNEELGRKVLEDPRPFNLRPCPEKPDTLGGDGLGFLTSAYFTGPCGCYDVQTGKCFHGNYGALACTNECTSAESNGINKDTLDRVGYGGAFLSAVAATEDYVRQIIEPLEEAHDERALAALLGVVGVGFAIDISGSMENALPGVKRTAVSMAGSPGLLNPDKSTTFVLAAFDGGTVESAVTDNPNEFAARVGLLVNRDLNYSCAENTCEALLAAINDLPPDSELYLFSDAPASDEALRSQVNAAARKKHIKIIECMENACGATAAASDSSASEPRPAFSIRSESSSLLSAPAGVGGFALETGGAVLGLSRSPTADYSSVILPGLLGRSQVFLSRTLPAPQARYRHAMAYDLARGVAVLFGGGTSTSLNGETWEWNGVSWSHRATTGPSPRSGHAMVYDAARGVTVLFGGYDSGDGYSGETWEWNGTMWSRRAITGPSGRNFTAMAYDSARGVTVLFGGYTSAGLYSGETWEWNGNAWTLRATAGPSARASHAVAYDSARGVTVLFGGNSSTVRNGETWEWNGNAWTLRATTGPSPLSSHKMAYDAARESTVLFGGSTGNYNGETWEWNGTSWTQRATTGPSPRISAAMAYDAARGVTVHFGGNSSAGLNGETWEWNGTAWMPATKLEIPVDTTSSMQVRVSSGVPSLFDPLGSLVTAATPGASVQAFGVSTVYTIASPTPGKWSLGYAASMSVQVVVDSDIAFADAAFVTDNSASPGGVHGGFAPIADLPLAGEAQILKATLLGGFADAQFSLVDEYGALIAPVSLSRNYPRAVADDYLGVVMPPAQPFRLVATGVSANGSVFRREFGTLFRSVPFRVAAPAEPPSPAPGGGQGLYTFTIENRGPARTLNITAVGVLGNAITATPASVTVPANGTQTVVVSDSTPCDSFLRGATGKVRLVASDASDSSLSNSAAVEVEVSPSGLGCLRSLSFGAVVLFGGYDGELIFSETWERNWSWIKRATTGPSARAQHAMAYDSVRDVTVLFGGSPYNGETWEWSGGSWTQIATTGPSARYGAAMAYDSVRGVTVLFGGAPSSGIRSGETWEWNGNAWSLRATTGPSPRHIHAMAYDSARGVTVLFGGDTGVNINSETWEWNGTSWILRATTGPLGRAYHAMAYDSVRRVTVLFGGRTLWAGLNGETWEWNGTAWTQRAAPGPSPREGPALAYDPIGGATVLFGGSTLAGHNDETWGWNGTSWSPYAAPGLSARSYAAMVFHQSSRLVGSLVQLGIIRLGSTVDLDNSSTLATLTFEDDTGAMTVFGSNAMIQSILDAAVNGNVLASISGTLTDSNGLRQLRDVTSVTPRDRSEPVHVIGVKPADFADHSSTAESLESHVVVLDNYTFAQSGAFAVGNYVNGGVTVRVSTAALAAAFNSQFGAIPTGVPLNITGVFSQNDTTPPYDGGYQLLATSIKIPCPADINGDGLVEDADFSIFVVAYNILDCADPTMMAGCPADLNGDAFVDDADFTVFVVAYNDLLCP